MNLQTPVQNANYFANLGLFAKLRNAKPPTLLLAVCRVPAARIRVVPHAVLLAVAPLASIHIAVAVVVRAVTVVRITHELTLMYAQKRDHVDNGGEGAFNIVTLPDIFERQIEAIWFLF